MGESCIYVHMYTHTYICISTYMYLYMMCIYICAYIQSMCVYLSIIICTYIIYTHLYLHLLTGTLYFWIRKQTIYSQSNMSSTDSPCPNPPQGDVMRAKCHCMQWLHQRRCNHETWSVCRAACTSDHSPSGDRVKETFVLEYRQILSGGGEGRWREGPSLFHKSET